MISQPNINKIRTIDKRVKKPIAMGIKKEMPKK